MHNIQHLIQNMKYPDDFINKIIQGDCLEIMKQMPDKCVDLVVTDPPYGLNFKYDTYEDTQENLSELVKSFMQEALRIGKLVVVTPGLNNIHLYTKPKWILSWFYKGGANFSPWGFNCWQPILVYGADPFLRDGKGCRPDVIEDNTPPVKNGHACPKPISFMEKLLLRTSTKDTDIIFDPFAGSGTTLVAAKKNNRQYIGIEISPKYCEIAQKRLDAQAKPLF